LSAKDFWDWIRWFAFMVLFWALIFGVTWSGRHHGISCSGDRGVVVE
jgi:hypothetical protein